jgi:hypothetical protein
MSIHQDIVQLGKRIAASHGWSAAKAFKAYEMNDADRATISRCGVDLLAIFPAAPNASALMSAALAVSLERAMTAPIHVVSGSLQVEGRPALESHNWLMIGPYIVDIALFRLAYSAEAPAILAKHVDLVFGANKALYVDHWSMTKRAALRYQPEQVLNEAQVTALMGDAFNLIKQARAPSSAV